MFYNDLDTKVSQNVWKKSDADEGWEYKVNLGPEKVVDPSVNSKQRIANIAVRKLNDTNERYELKVPIIQKGSDLPIGTIIAYVGDLSKIPSGWYLCDGTNGTPDLRDRFLEGVGNFSVKSFISAGLPNITGRMNTADNELSLSSVGAFYPGPVYGYPSGSQNDRPANSLNFDASRSNPIYGKSLTVQPESYIVYYIIRLK